VHADSSEKLGVGGRENSRHRAARRQARDKDAGLVNVVHSHYLARHARDDGRFASPALLVCGLEPIPAPGSVSRNGLLGKKHQQPFCFRHEVHASAGSKIIGALSAAMEHHD
jgi:hypothetical protein